MLVQIWGVKCGSWGAGRGLVAAGENSGICKREKGMLWVLSGSLNCTEKMVGKEKEVVLVLSGGEHSSVDSNHERGEEEAVRGRPAGRDARQPVVTATEGVSAKDGRACEEL